jgi:hypothetical protein
MSRRKKVYDDALKKVVPIVVPPKKRPAKPDKPVDLYTAFASQPELKGMNKTQIEQYAFRYFTGFGVMTIDLNRLKMTLRKQGV